MSPVSWSSRIHSVSLQRSKPPPQCNECSGYDTKQSDDETPVILGLWGMQGSPSLPLPLGQLLFSEVSPERVLWVK